MSTRRTRTGLIVSLCLSTLMWATGCASAPKHETEVAAKALGLGTEAPAGSVLTVRDAFPFVALADDAPVPGAEVKESSGALVSRWEVLAGKHKGKVIRQERTPDGARTWRIRTVIEGEGTALQEQVLRFDPSSNSLVLVGTKQFDEGVSVEMRPPPAAMPAELTEGKTVTQSMALRMPYLKDPQRVRAQGKGEMTLRYDADQSVKVERRHVDARRVREVFTTDVTAAQAVRTIERWFVPGVGRVAERWDEDVKVLGLISEHTEQTIRLLPP